MFVKYRFGFVIAIFVTLYILIIGMFFKFYEDLALKDAKQEAFHILDTMNAVRDYISLIQRPLINELKDKGDLNPDFFDPRLLSSSYVAREIYKLQAAKNNTDYDYKLVATDPLNPAHLGNEFENEILEGFKEGRYSEFSRIVKDENASYIFVGLPIKNSHASCVVCHNINSAPKKMIERYGGIANFEGKVGDTIAMVSFKIPIKNVLLNHTKEFIFSALVLFIIFAILVFFIYKIHEKVAKIKEQNKFLMISQSRLASMGEMIGNISHQWKQPLAQISGTLINLQLHAERGKLDNARLNEKIKEIDEQVKFMSDTIDDFKNFFNPNIQKREFSSSEAIEKACKILNSALKSHAIKIDVEIQQNFNIFGNINEIIQILINVINNAKEALAQTKDKQRSVKIISKASSYGNFIEIENNAERIPPHVIGRIFEPHFTTKDSGSGLGLYMSHVIMEKNGGEISAQNTEQGVKFTIKFLNL